VNENLTEVVVINDADDGALFDDGAVVTAIVAETADTAEERAPGIADQAASWLQRAKSGYTKAKVEHETHDGTTPRVGPWERITAIAPTVAGVVKYHSTGTARPSASVVIEERVAVAEAPKPKPLPDVIHEATEEAAGLIHAEIELAKTEIKAKMKAVLPAIGFILIALFIILYAILVLILAAVMGLAVVLPVWASALIIGVAMLIGAALLIWAGVKALKRVGRVQFLAGGTIKDDIHAIVDAFKSRNWAIHQEALKEGRL